MSTSQLKPTSFRFNTNTNYTNSNGILNTNIDLIFLLQSATTFYHVVIILIGNQYSDSFVVLYEGIDQSSPVKLEKFWCKTQTDYRIENF